MTKSYKGNYGKSSKQNFKVIDSIGVPHPYCITPKHLKNAGMYLGKEEIIKAEKNGAVCGTCYEIKRKTGKPILSYDEHKHGLLIECKKEINFNKELHAYLLKIKDNATKNGYIGFAFIKAKGLV